MVCLSFLVSALLRGSRFFSLKVENVYIVCRLTHTYTGICTTWTIYAEFAQWICLLFQHDCSIFSVEQMFVFSFFFFCGFSSVNSTHTIHSYSYECILQTCSWISWSKCEVIIFQTLYLILIKQNLDHLQVLQQSHHMLFGRSVDSHDSVSRTPLYLHCCDKRQSRNTRVSVSVLYLCKLYNTRPFIPPMIYVPSLDDMV